MTQLYLDVEFNSFGGDLISLALYNPGGESWYEVASLPPAPHPFVRDHVIPVLGKAPMGKDGFMASLHAYLKQFQMPEIIADWPEDFSHFFNCLCKPGGWQLQFECRATLLLSGKFDPEIRHNALSDAKALAEWHSRQK